ncbi:UDP-glucose 6-dehydrogenase [endosymbiont of Acanthamoeba sp. UWC8]|uniref:UDP-glucose dehydrogenase family protein n=1 Tax=endosymbiont of Acanthamoeba sp. UWC8 TaxID=86106 RepID=UPI0004D145DC|nr:UDP-glucose/GDP-mannose dehydrogenase family protein [endosymbiont of Acanthamoeba sp. UWC8]AIF80617.1 UDP-glucose 6-dehydrogenase [endosymbiont of Acanthamoeba sp. UWC8]
MKVTVIGTGYVGLVAGTCFANFGIEVNCIDNDVTKINALKEGVIPIYEPGLEELVIKNYKNGHLHFSTDKSLLDKADVLVIAVGTPAAKDGNANMTYLDSVLEDIAKYVNHDKYIIIKSTVPVGTANRVKKTLEEKRQDLKFSIISNPEFLREGSAVNDFFYPDRIVIGTMDEESKEIARKLYAPVIVNDTHIEFTDNSTAEIIKYAANAFLAMKVAFINEISDIAEQFGGNIEDISNGIGSDKRIGKHFLKPGPGYGGSCFPKDTLALAKAANDASIPSLIINAVIDSNDRRKAKMASKVISALNGDINGKTIAILGLTFKAETDDMRDSASIDIINTLKNKGAVIKAYDPKGMEEAKKIFGNSIEYCDDIFTAANNAEALCIITEWAEFKTLDLQQLQKCMQQPIIIDLRNIYSREEMSNSGFTYISLGRAKVN